MFEDIQNYLKEAPLDSGWPCWEMNDHEIVKGDFIILIILSSLPVNFISQASVGFHLI